MMPAFSLLWFFDEVMHSVSSLSHKVADLLYLLQPFNMKTRNQIIASFLITLVVNNKQYYNIMYLQNFIIMKLKIWNVYQ